MGLNAVQPIDASLGEVVKAPYVPPVPLTRGQKVKRWFRKYFLEGQHLDDEAEGQLHSLPENPTWEDLIFIKYRKFVAMLIPFAFMQIIWWMLAIRYNFFQWYPDYWHMPVTMALGSFVGGMTSEGSGAVAFPVMTLALHINPQIARDFSIMIQSCGMTSALMCVIFMKVKFEHRAVILGTIGAIPGFIIGVHFVDPLFTGPQKKMLFVSIWTAFAIALAILNSQKRTTYKEIPDFCFYKGFILVVTGFVGGVFDAFAGSGIDICIFAIVTLLFRVTEKTVTPTTVVLKGINAVFGFFYRAAMMGDISAMAWTYFSLSVPVSATVGPLGSFLGSHLHRQVVAAAVYILEAIALIGFLLTKPTWQLIAIGGCIIFGGYIFFSGISRAGLNIMNTVEEKKKKAQRENTTV
ncbi:unnamed protein product [Nippostrongylus brasiliensis]|uniref:Membrane transporter protein n=1 Tax=Nippostrongylus brasiliensis TaxID=27835 RepID=A0A0N4YJW2_NIPBR|nr:hypothetical protein Q1695_015604 [Nippostrongylus brasiliensis]VDL80897.1 unnamed protein product [Nippostrongylus brasiliensis]